MDFMFLTQVVLAIVMAICFVGWIITSHVERDSLVGNWRGRFMGGWLVFGLAGIVIALIRYGGM